MRRKVDGTARNRIRLRSSGLTNVRYRMFSANYFAISWQVPFLNQRPRTIFKTKCVTLLGQVSININTTCIQQLTLNKRYEKIRSNQSPNPALKTETGYTSYYKYSKYKKEHAVNRMISYFHKGGHSATESELKLI